MWDSGLIDPFPDSLNGWPSSYFLHFSEVFMGIIYPFLAPEPGSDPNRKDGI
jgi:hypothetical protein